MGRGVGGEGGGREGGGGGGGGNQGISTGEFKSCLL